MLNINKSEWVKAIKEELQNSIPTADTRADISIQQTVDDSEIQEVIANVRARNGDVKWIDEGLIMTYTNNKVSLFAILDYLEENDYVLDYEVQLIETQFNGVNINRSDEIDIDDIRDMNNLFFKILIYMNPEVVPFDPTYVDADDLVDRNDYTTTGISHQQYVFESQAPVIATWQGTMNETIIVTEAKGKKTLVVVPPTVKDGEAYFDINKYNVDSASDNGAKKMFQDMGFTMTNISKNADIDYEMNGKANDVLLFDLESSHKDGADIAITEMLNTIIEKQEGVTVFAEQETLTEIKRKAKVNFKGKKRIKIQCAKGFKYDANRRVCVKISGSEMMKMKRSHIKMARTKKSAGIGFKNRTVRKMRKANRFRKLMGIQNGRTY